MAFLDETGLAELWSLVKENDVMASKKAFQVGDTLNTIRTDLGENWFLCNGDLVNASELSDEFRNMLGVGWGKKTIADSYTNSANGLYMCRRWVTHGDEIITYGADRTSRYPQIYIANKENPLDFETVTIANSKQYIAALAYGNGLWVAVTCSGALSSGALYVYTATDLRGPWTGRTNAVANVPHPGAGYITLAYGNGTWAVAYKNSSDSNYLTTSYTTDPLGDWTTYRITNEVLAPVDLLYEANQWVLLVPSRMYYTADITQQNKWKAAYYINPNLAYSAYGLYHINEYYIICTRYTDSNDDGYPAIFYATDITGTWKRARISSDLITEARSITYESGQWVVACGKPVLYIASSLDGEWTKSVPTDSNGDDMTAYSMTDITYVDGRCWLLGDHSGGIVISEQICTLPSVSIDGVYTYIKAKEDEKSVG